MNRIGRRLNRGGVAPMFRDVARANESRGGPAMDFKITVCLLLLIAIVAAVRYGLYSALDAYGFWPYMAICGCLTALIIAAAFAWDHYEARR